MQIINYNAKLAVAKHISFVRLRYVQLSHFNAKY